MGATGGLFGRKRRTKKSEDIFGVRGAERFESAAPKQANFDKPGAGRIQLRVPSDEGKDIIFQFKLTRENKLSIIGYDPNVPSRGKVRVLADRPSLDSVINSPKASAADKANAQRLRDMFTRTKNGVKESSLASIANALQREKGKNK